MNPETELVRVACHYALQGERPWKKIRYAVARRSTRAISAR
jgi:hypothetical protein